MGGMSLKPFLWVVGVGVGVGLLWPSSRDATPEKQQIAAVTYTPQSKGSGSVVTETQPLEVVLRRESDGHFYANVEVNGQTIRFLVDTGAGAVALTGDDARRLGMSWTDSELQQVGRGVSGPVQGKFVELHHMKLGGKEAWDMDGAIIPNGLDVSLLGQNFLSQIGSVKIVGDDMILR